MNSNNLCQSCDAELVEMERETCSECQEMQQEWRDAVDSGLSSLEAAFLVAMRNATD